MYMRPSLRKSVLSTQKTPVYYYGANLLFCILCYIKSVSFIEFPMDCVNDEIFITIVRKYKNCYILKYQNKAKFYV